jgi:hypothetical protein
MRNIIPGINKLIEKFGELTGVVVVLNTSLILKENLLFVLKEKRLVSLPGVLWIDWYWQISS